MNAKCVDCGLTMSVHEMLAHECPAPGAEKLLTEEQADADEGPSEGDPPPGVRGSEGVGGEDAG
jgi:hypothetical protein